MKRSDLKYLKLIPKKGWSKNKPTCENAVSQTLCGSCTLRVMGSCFTRANAQWVFHGFLIAL